jgi:hypothetical protein
MELSIISKMPELLDCYEVLPEVRRRPISTVLIAFTLNQRGEVEDLDLLASEIVHLETSQCIVAVIEGIKFLKLEDHTEQADHVSQAQITAIAADIERKYAAIERKESAVDGRIPGWINVQKDKELASARQTRFRYEDYYLEIVFPLRFRVYSP